MADEVIAKYKADLKDYNSQIKKGTNQAEKDFDKVDESASGLGKTIGKIGAAMAAAFAVDRIVSFTAEASKLAAQGEGIRKAFERIGDPQLLQGLRDATRGTVSDLELMKQAVRASNFKIPLQDLAKLFEFARRRAKETGEEVDYLVNSIVLGIGRKSPLILDNLGISAVELRKKLKGVGVEAASVGDISKIIGEIATDAMSKMGEEVDNTNDKMQQLTASTANLKEALGTIANEVAGPLASGLANVVQSISNEITEIDRFRDSLADATASEIDAVVNDQKRILDDLESDLVQKIGRISDAQATMSQGEIDDTKEKIRIAEELLFIKETSITTDEITVDLIGKVTKVTKEGNEANENAIKNVAFWRAEIKRLQEELKNENATIDENIATVNALTHATEELNKIMGKVKPFKDVIDAENEMQSIDDVAVAQETLGDLLKEAYGESAQDEMYAYREEEMNLSEAAILQAKREADEKEYLAERQQQAALDGFYAVIALTQAAQEASLNYEQQLLDEQLEGGIISRERYEQETNKLRKESAKQAKEMALFEATTGTAMAVMNALSDTTVPYYLAVINAATAAALGAAEIATIASQPIPQFAKGTKNAPAGFKWVGEEGPELIYDQGGYPIITHRESMKILEKYNIPSINYEAVERGGFEGIMDSARLNGFNDSNLLFGLDRSRTATVKELRLLRGSIDRLGKTQKRGGYA